MGKIQFEFSGRAYETIQSIGRYGGISDREVVSKSLATMEWLISQVRAGRMILLRDKNGELQEIVLPIREG